MTSQSNFAPDVVIHYLVLNVLKSWYLQGKTSATLHEIYDVLGVDYDIDEEDAAFDISERVREVEDQLIAAGLDGSVH
jgi:hypothetical protein